MNNTLSSLLIKRGDGACLTFIILLEERVLYRRSIAMEIKSGFGANFYGEVVFPNWLG
jgi:hypothetical protein